MLVNISSIQDYQRCPRRWLYAWVLNRVPRDTPQPFTFGKLFHKYMDLHVQRVDYPWEKMLAGTDPNDPAVQQLCTYRDVLLNWHDEYPVDKTLETEEPFKIKLPGQFQHELRGRPDRVGLMWGKVWHIQYKSIAAQRNVGLYLKTARRHLHELAYAYYLREKYKDYEYGGSLFTMLRKLQHKSKRDGKVLHGAGEILMQGIVPIDAVRVKEAITDIVTLADGMTATMQAYHQHGTLPPSNRTQDCGMFGNSEDPYTPVMLGERDLADDTYFMDREDTYADTQGAGEGD